MGPVIARFQYALPAFAGQLTVSDISKIDANISIAMLSCNIELFYIFLFMSYIIVKC